MALAALESVGESLRISTLRFCRSFNVASFDASAPTAPSAKPAPISARTVRRRALTVLLQQAEPGALESVVPEVLPPVRHRVSLLPRRAPRQRHHLLRAVRPSLAQAA